MPGLRDLTQQQKDELRVMLRAKGELNPYIIAQAYIIRATNTIFIGRCVMATSQDIELSPVVWLANPAAYRVVIAGGPPAAGDIERIAGPVILGRSQILEAIEWRRALP